jgi:hypothetical protein
MQGHSSAGDYTSWQERLLPAKKKDWAGQLTIEQMAKGMRDTRFDADILQDDDFLMDVEACDREDPECTACQ